MMGNKCPTCDCATTQEGVVNTINETINEIRNNEYSLCVLILLSAYVILDVVCKVLNRHKNIIKKRERRRMAQSTFNLSEMPPKQKNCSNT